MDPVNQLPASRKESTTGTKKKVIREKLIKARVTKEEYALLEKICEQKLLSMSDLIRTVLLSQDQKGLQAALNSTNKNADYKKAHDAFLHVAQATKEFKRLQINTANNINQLVKGGYFTTNNVNALINHINLYHRQANEIEQLVKELWQLLK